MAAWERAENRQSIIRDGCDLTALCSFGDEQFGTRFTLLIGLSGPLTSQAEKTEVPHKAQVPRQLRMKKIRLMLRYRNPESPR